jgi:hypothetical protein
MRFILIAWYRIRLQDGTFYAFPDALTAPGGLRVLKGQKHNLSGDDLGRVEALAACPPDEQMAVSAERHRRDHDDGGWLLRDRAHVVALKSGYKLIRAT